MNNLILIIFVTCFSCASCKIVSDFFTDLVHNLNHSIKSREQSFNNSALDPYKDETGMSLYIDNRSKMPSITIPVVIHLDRSIARTIIKKHSPKAKEKAWLMFRRILKTVEMLFLLPSLNEVINFQLLDVKILRNGTGHVKTDENVSKYLKSYCLWQAEQKITKNKIHYSILFTGMDLYYLDKGNNQVKTSTGRGYIGGVCSLKNSCTVLEWHRENVAYILAHEVAHSLGVSHDGPPNKNCYSTGKHIMSSKYNPKNPARTWSPCNKYELRQFLLSKKASCLHSKELMMN